MTDKEKKARRAGYKAGYAACERKYKKDESAKARSRKICKGSVVRWHVRAVGNGFYGGGTLTEFVRYTPEGQIWKVETIRGDIIERVIDVGMITKFGPTRVGRPRAK